MNVKEQTNSGPVNKPSTEKDESHYRTLATGLSSPNCRIIPSSSRVTHSSIILSFSKRKIAIAFHVTVLPVTS